MNDHQRPYELIAQGQTETIHHLHGDGRKMIKNLLEEMPESSIV